MSLRLITLVFLSRFSCRTALAQMKRKIPIPMTRGPRTFSRSEWRYLQKQPITAFRRSQLLLQVEMGLQQTHVSFGWSSR